MLQGIVIKYALCVHYIMCMQCNIFSHEVELTERETEIFKPVCERLSMPLQPPIAVNFLKKACITEKTGRIIEYKSQSCDANSSSDCDLTGCTVVTCLTGSCGSQYGFIDKLFMYNAIEFAIVRRFNSKLTITNGFVLVSDYTKTTQVVCPLKELSRPLIFAADTYPKLWIVNAHLS